MGGVKGEVGGAIVCIDFFGVGGGEFLEPVGIFFKIFVNKIKNEKPPE